VRRVNLREPLLLDVEENSAIFSVSVEADIEASVKYYDVSSGSYDNNEDRRPLPSSLAGTRACATICSKSLSAIRTDRPTL
jgi:hypothetical protein